MLWMAHERLVSKPRRYGSEGRVRIVLRPLGFQRGVISRSECGARCHHEVPIAADLRDID